VIRCNVLKSIEVALIELEYLAAEAKVIPPSGSHVPSEACASAKQVAAFYDAACHALEIALENLRAVEERTRPRDGAWSL
jgi:hypothetical protein